MTKKYTLSFRVGDVFLGNMALIGGPLMAVDDSVHCGRSSFLFFFTQRTFIQGIKVTGFEVMVLHAKINDKSL